MKEENEWGQKIRRENFLAKGLNRNKICICGSGKKAKKCHGKDQFISVQDHVILMEMYKLHQRNIHNMTGLGEVIKLDEVKSDQDN